MKKNEKYPENVRKFCLTLHYHSPRAYQFVRETFNRNLPHYATIRKWYSNSNINAKANVINEQCLNILKIRAAEMEKNGKKLYCAISFDEIHIKKHIQWSNTEKRLTGYVAAENDSVESPEVNKKLDVANQALVFIVSGINDSFELPIAHYFTKSMDANAKKRLLEQIIEKIMDCGAVVKSLACDGFSANLTMFKLFGAELKIFSDNFKTYITVRGVRIYIFLDSCHMLKLVRNKIATKQTLYDGDGNEVCWQYLVDLVRMKDRGFGFTHKMNRKHINWEQRKMKVDVAAQTLSESTASSIEYLLKKGVTEFAGAEATIQFIRTFNNLFDVFNSKNEESDNLFKNAISAKNSAQIFTLFDEATKYIKGLQFKNENGRMIKVCCSKISTGFNGFIINMASLKLMYEEMVESEGVCDSIRTYYLQQDPVEILFGKVRYLNRTNTNPTEQQFSGTLRKLLAYNTVMYSKFANCNLDENASVNQFYSNILSVTSTRSTMTFNISDSIEVDEEEIERLYNKLDEITANEQPMNETDENLNDSAIAIAAKFIEQRIKMSKKFDCLLCRPIFDENEQKVDDVFVGAGVDGMPCSSTFEICKQTDRFLKLELLKDSANFNVIYHEIMAILNFDSLYQDTDFSEHGDHKVFLIRYVVNEYIRIKGTDIAKSETLKVHEKSLRSKLHKLLHFLGQ